MQADFDYDEESSSPGPQAVDKNENGWAAGVDEEFESIWQNSHVDWDSLQQTPMAELALSFLLADMVASLKEHKSSPTEIEQLLMAFRNYREHSSNDRLKSTQEFQQVLEAIACRNEFLIARSADLQSKLAELCRLEQAPQ